MNVGDEVYEAGYSYVTLTLIDTLGESALVERTRDRFRFWIPVSNLRRM